MWAQGLTVGVLIAAGVVTHANRSQIEEEGPVRHLVRFVVAMVVVIDRSCDVRVQFYRRRITHGKTSLSMSCKRKRRGNKRWLFRHEPMLSPRRA